jgi:hypothetical protein
MGHKENIYRAIIWTEDGKPGLRVSVVADNLEDARKQLEAKYGQGHVFDLHNEEDAERPR